VEQVNLLGLKIRLFGRLDGFVFAGFDWAILHRVQFRRFFVFGYWLL